ncbi:MAG: hypothetical protein RLY95_526 [Pseudomonadota bacterium]|jgi:hypothetical protein
MPLESGYPSEWAIFCSHATNTGSEFFGFTKPLADVNRFAARFRAANTFRGISLEGYSAATASGYAALCRVLFVYSAFETFLDVIGSSQAAIGPNLQAHGAIELLNKLRATDTENRFYLFIQQRVNPTHGRELQNYFNDDPCNVAYLASAIRHIFAHGWLTPNAGGGEASAAANVCDAVCDFLLSFMDAQFTDRIVKGMTELYDA